MKEKQRPRIAETVRGEEVELVGEAQRQLVAGGDRLDGDEAAKIGFAEALAGIAGERLGEARDIVGLESQATGGPMAAEAQQPIGAGGDAGQQVERRVLRPEPLAMPSVSLSRMVGRPV